MGSDLAEAAHAHERNRAVRRAGSVLESCGVVFFHTLSRTHLYDGWVNGGEGGVVAERFRPTVQPLKNTLATLFSQGFRYERAVLAQHSRWVPGMSRPLRTGNHPKARASAWLIICGFIPYELAVRNGTILIV